MSDPATTSTPARHPLTVRHFRNLWIGSTVSFLGDQFYLVALPWLVLQLTGSSLALGTVLMVTAIPRAALMLVGGAVTDRVSARRVLITTVIVRTALVGVVTALVYAHALALWHLYGLTFAFGVADAFSFPAGPTLIPSLVDASQLPAANALMQSSTVLTQMVGPAPAGLVIRARGIAAALLFDTLSFFAALTALVSLPAARPAAPPDGTSRGARGGMLRSIAEGLRAVHADRPLRSLMLVFAAINVCVTGPIFVGLASVARFRFGSAAAFGTFLSCFSGGAFVGMVAGGFIKRPRRRGLQIIIVGALAGLEMIVIGLAPRFAVIAAMLAVMGTGIGFVNVQFSAWIQSRVERALLGRVMSVLMFAAVGLTPLSYAASGAIARWSLRGLFLAAGAALVLASGPGLMSKAAREID